MVFLKVEKVISHISHINHINHKCLRRHFRILFFLNDFQSSFIYSSECLQIISYNFLNSAIHHFTTWWKFSSTLQYGYHLTTCFSTNVLMYCQLLFTYGEVDNLELSTRSTNAENTKSTTYHSYCLFCCHNF